MKFIRSSVAIAVGYALIATATAADSSRPDASFQAGPMTITPGGFLEFTSIYRHRNETADIGSSFAGVPFRNNSNYDQTEFRQTERNSRFSLLVQGSQDDGNRLEAYLETDFVSAGASSNSVESNSYTLRVRQAFLDWSRADRGWAVTAGQAWTLATAYKQGLAPRQEDIPLVDDGQYHTGYTWARQTQLRIVKTFSPAVAAALSLETPQNFLKGPTPSGALANNPGGAGMNSGTTYSTDIAPDVILKFAFDPGFGHYEVYSLTRFLHDRAPRAPGALSTQTHDTTVAESAGGALILPVVRGWLDLHLNTLVGHGNGRYGSAQLPDSTYNTSNGSISALREQQAVVGLIGHASRTLDVYAYAGLEQQRAAYGLIPTDNTACAVPADSGQVPPQGSACGSVGRVRQVSGGFLWKFYQSRLGFLEGGPEVEYVTNTTYTARNATSGHTDDTMVYFTVRYHPFQ